MDKPTQPIRAHHASLMDSLRAFYEFLDRLDSMKGEADGAELDEYKRFFTDDLEPHADGEERALYPAVEPLIKAHGSATASMSMDHAALKRLISDFAEKADSLAGASGKDAQALRREIVRSGYQIYGILSVHFAKEEDIYLELLDQHMSSQQVEEIVHRMHAH